MSELLADLQALRRRLHADPEIGLELPRTQAVLLEALEPLGLEVRTGTATTSITAVLRGGRPGPAVLLRGDMDGLPIAEATGLPFASANGAMHACGHDLHMAGLVGAARLLAARQAELAGDVIFAFQPGEEGYAGARVMLDEGLLAAAGEAPIAAYAIHVDSLTPARTWVTRQGPIMASASGFRIRISARGGHAASPQLGVDPIPVAAELVLAIQSFVTRRISAVDPAVISVTGIASDSSAPNVLSANVDLAINVRTLSRETLDLVRERLPELAAGIAAAHGCTAESEFLPNYPVTVNDPAETARVLAYLDETHGVEQVTRMPNPAMASEDFAYMLEEVPGTLLFLGAMVEGEEPAAPMHSDRTRFDDGVLELQARTLSDLAAIRLGLPM